MSGSYGNLLQQYNTILALELANSGSSTLNQVCVNSPDLQGVAPLANQVVSYDGSNVVWASGGLNPTLQDVIVNGSSSQYGAEFVSGITHTDINSSGVSIDDGVGNISNFAQENLILTNSTKYIGIVLNPEPTITLQNNTTQTTGTLNTTSIEFFDNINSVGSRLDTTGLQIGISNPTSYTANQIIINGIYGANGQVLGISGGELAWKQQDSGLEAISAPSTSGTINFHYTFPTAPTVTLTQKVSGNLVSLGITSVSTTSFSWVSSAPNVGSIYWIAQ